MAYSETDKIKALTLLATNEYDYQKTSTQLGIPKMTLYRWNKDENVINDTIKPSLKELLERAIEELFELMPMEWSGNSWAVAVGILTDKLFLMNGQATSRTETIATKLGSMEPEKLEEIMQEARRIIEESEDEKVKVSA